VTVTVYQDGNNSGQIRRQEYDRNIVEDPDTDPDSGQKGLANFRQSVSGSVISILDPARKNKEVRELEAGLQTKQIAFL
jgi:hypothetical protein